MVWDGAVRLAATTALQAKLEGAKMICFAVTILLSASRIIQLLLVALGRCIWLGVRVLAQFIGVSEVVDVAIVISRFLCFLFKFTGGNGLGISSSTVVISIIIFATMIIIR